MAVVSKKKKILMGEAFVNNVNAMHREEIFGIKNCLGITWECIFKDYMILTSLRCDTGDVYDENTVNCLFNKVTNIKR